MCKFQISHCMPHSHSYNRYLTNYRTKLHRKYENIQVKHPRQRILEMWRVALTRTSKCAAGQETESAVDEVRDTYCTCSIRRQYSFFAPTFRMQQKKHNKENTQHFIRLATVFRQKPVLRPFRSDHKKIVNVFVVFSEFVCVIVFILICDLFGYLKCELLFTYSHSYCQNIRFGSEAELKDKPHWLNQPT